jgi:hypothetical protein
MPPRPNEGSAPWGLEPPLSQTPWSPDFVLQELELLIVYLGADGIHALRPIHASSLGVGWAPGREAASILAAALARYQLPPRVLHSTSWRQDGNHVVLTYLAVVDEPSEPGSLSPHLVDELVGRVDLARGAAETAPTSIAIGQVLEHALRHLAWLVAEDPAVATELPAWRPALAAYVPETFRGL